MTKRELIVVLQKQSDTSYADAKFLATHERWSACCNRLYYALFQGVRAFLVLEDFSSKTHASVRSAFGKELILTGAIPYDYGKIYSRLFAFRLRADYGESVDFNPEQIKDYLEPVGVLLQLIKEITDDRLSSF